MTQSPTKLSTKVPGSRCERGAGGEDKPDLRVPPDSPPASNESCARGAGDSDDTSSCLQVVVERQRSRLPAASSPRVRLPPAPAHADQPLLFLMPYTDDYNSWPPDNATTQPLQPPPPLVVKQKSKSQESSLWRKLKHVATDTSLDDECAGVEVYWLERVAGGALVARGGWGECDTASSRASTAAGRVCARAFAEVLGAGRAVVWAPVALCVATLRCGLCVVRDAAVGTLGALADYVFKPTLALLYNGLVQPVCVTGRACAVALEEAVVPVARAATAAVAPLVHVLTACRLVHVHIEPRCTCRCPADRRPV